MTAPADLDDDIVLPDPPTPPPRPTLPLFASIVPVAGAVGLWAVTGSVLSLWFAVLGPFIAAATLVDGTRTGRRTRRTAERSAAAARRRADGEIDERHAAERRRLDRRHPDAGAFLSGTAEPWRLGDGRMLFGRGVVASTLRVRGGVGEEASRMVRLRAARLEDAPIVGPMSGVVAICGPPALADSVVRALVVQVCSAYAPTELRVVGRVSDDHWSAALPHRRGSGTRTLALADGAGASGHGADLVLLVVGADTGAPPGATTVVRMTGPVAGELDDGEGSRPLALEALSEDQAHRAVAALDRRARRMFGEAATASVAFDDLVVAEGPVSGLAAAIGMEDGHPAVVDLVADGPHAVVVGVTGAGKSELLATWVAALCRSHPPDRLSVLLADFKGGTTFHALAALPHVTGVITDLDEAGARRAIESLRAEIRRRESALTEAGARDAGDPRAGLGRLVVVVDEFAVLLGSHPELLTVFADVAARGRALGMHLVLGTQRATGVIRDGLLANCPLRIALRVTDASDARMLVGAPDAATLPGDPASRGLAYVRRAGDDRPRLTRIALTTPGDIARIAASAGAGAATLDRPWLPELPDRIGLTDLDRIERAGDIVLGLADDPAAQRQRVAVLGHSDRGLIAIGGAGSGKTALVQLVAAQIPARRLVRIPRDPEAAWDAVARLAAAVPEPGVVVVLDDADALPARFPSDHGREIAERIERLARDAGDLGIRLVATAQRPLGLAGRLGELLPRRLVLGTSSRADHVAAGGDPAFHRPRIMPGRGSLDGLEVQVALADGIADEPAQEQAAVWTPAGLTGLVIREGAASVVAACLHLGVAARTVEAAAIDERPPTGALVVWGDPDAWQRHWRLLALVREHGELVVDAGCAADLRALTGLRGLPPYCRPGAGRAWRATLDGPLERVLLPGRGGAAPRRRETD